MKKILVSIFAVLLVFLGVHKTAYADVERSDTTVRASLNMKVGDSVSKEFIDSFGEKNTIVVTKVSEPSVKEFRSAWGQVHAEKANNGTYHINYIRGFYNCGFYININTRTITDAYDLWYNHFVGVNSANLVREGTRQATAYFEFQASTPWINGPSWNGALRASLDADYLVTYVK
ncbi:hypothetical protein BVE84_09665 [Streptococcus azizii]|uniref:DUF5626 domain-containing protein n=1 Tax=Streptococcus azizii TaxID=1579424 RepID=A0AB36JR44_9STRE|nr:MULTISPECIES: DUF5626 family protein [Streptococcus]MBF0776378.1 DUF5626 family protein [Streptococcus sp. 19428wD3_AN2]ONK26046.1 hypothetical protein BVE84_09665 [Streptococcus azizii]ONK27114.1 hypothetical protein BVE86_05995 [Streptococcus azizii]ONK28467.1 hypothetical protein BVE85_04855 [Streptococcus azizii]TFU83154.1 hypothetical protein E4T83_06275 [Streptococcus sp. AN2]